MIVERQDFDGSDLSGWDFDSYEFVPGRTGQGITPSNLSGDAGFVLPNSGPEFTMGFYVKTTASALSARSVFIATGDDGDMWFRVYFEEGVGLSVEHANHGVVDADPVELTGDWKFMEIQALADDVAGFIEVRINEVVVLRFDGDTVAGNYEKLSFEGGYHGLVFDDVYITDDLTYLGIVQSEAGIVVPSAVVAFIAWAKGNAYIDAVVNGRVSSSLPKAGLVFPWVQARRITGVPQIPTMPMDFARVQIDIWGGRTSNGLPDYAAADLPARVIEAEIRAFRGKKVGDAFISEMTPFEGMQQLEDAESGDARFWMDARVVVRRADGQ